MCIAHNKTDFIGPVKPIQNAKVNGINSHLQLEGVGKVCWSMLDAAGIVCDIKLPAHFARKACQRLLSTSIFCNKHPNNKVTLNPKSWNVQPDLNDHNKSSIDILLLSKQSQQPCNQLLSSHLNHSCPQLQSVTTTMGITQMSPQTWMHWNAHSSIHTDKWSIHQHSNK